MNKFIFKIRYFLSLKYGRIDKDYSRVIGSIIDSDPIIENDYSQICDKIYYLTLNGVDIWVSNMFYAFGTLRGERLMLDSETAYKLYMIYKSEIKKCRESRYENLRKRIVKCSR